ncbi:hypothetical protein GGE07_005113 [Sinorhizobium terangae]|nr:hypothetical protein [Sinorhizobium terangae]
MPQAKSGLTELMVLSRHDLGGNPKIAITA